MAKGAEEDEELELAGNQGHGGRSAAVDGPGHGQSRRVVAGVRVGEDSGGDIAAY